MASTRKVPYRKTIDHRAAIIERTYQMREELGHCGKWQVIVFLKSGEAKYSKDVFRNEAEAQGIADEIQKIAKEPHDFPVKCTDSRGAFWFWDREFSHVIAMPAGKG